MRWLASAQGREQLDARETGHALRAVLDEVVVVVQRARLEAWPLVLELLGGGAEDEIAGFIYLGSCAEKPAERSRPELEDIVCFGLPETSST